MILIASATKKEIEILKKAFYKKEHIKFFVTGIGIVNTTFFLQQFLNNSPISFSKLIFTGIGGGFFDSGVKIGDICYATSEILGDFGVCYKDRVDYKFNDNYLIDIRNKNFKNSGFDKIGNFITVNCVTTEKEKVKFFQDKFTPVCENMEGFAAAFVANKFKLDFFEIRSISNFVGERDNWQIEKALNILSDFLIEFIKDELY